MTTHPTHLRASSAPRLEKQFNVAWALLLMGLGLLGLIAYHARMGAVSARIANPEVTGVPRPVEFLFGWGDRWLVVHEWGTVVMMVVILVACVRAWRRQPGHPFVLM